MDMIKAVLGQAQEVVAEAQKQRIVLGSTRTVVLILIEHSRNSRFSNMRRIENRRCGDEYWLEYTLRLRLPYLRSYCQSQAPDISTHNEQHSVMFAYQDIQSSRSVTA